MKISQMIEGLKKFMEEYGDLDCYYPGDDEMNYIERVYFPPNLLYIDESGEHYTAEYYKEMVAEAEECGEEPPEMERICLVC